MVKLVADMVVKSDSLLWAPYLRSTSFVMGKSSRTGGPFAGLFSDTTSLSADCMGVSFLARVMAGLLNSVFRFGLERVFAGDLVLEEANSSDSSTVLSSSLPRDACLIEPARGGFGGGSCCSLVAVVAGGVVALGVKLLL